MEQSQQPQSSMKPPLDTGTEILPRERVVLVEPFNPDDNPNFKPKGVRQSRVVLFGRSFLSPKTPEEFVKDHGFVLIEKDRVAINPDHLSTEPGKDEVLHVRRFESRSDRPPRRDFKTDVFWDGGYTSLETEPHVVYQILHPQPAEPAPGEQAPPAESPAQPQPQQRRRGRLSFNGPRVG
jgi:hypothetical protein